MASNLVHLIQLDEGHFVADCKYDEITLGGWYVPLSMPVELRYVTVDTPAGKARKFDKNCLPTSRYPARLCMKHRRVWTEVGPCPACVPRPVSEPKPQLPHPPEIQFSEAP